MREHSKVYTFIHKYDAFYTLVATEIVLPAILLTMIFWGLGILNPTPVRAIALGLSYYYIMNEIPDFIKRITNVLRKRQ